MKGWMKNDPVSAAITQGLGGKSNIEDVDCCATRLRCTVADPSKVSDALLRSTGASGVIRKGKGVQVIYGPNVTVIKSNLENYLEAILADAIVTADYGSEPSDVYRKNDVISGNRIIHSPMTGIAAPLATCPDPAFAEGIMGDGAVVTPTDPLVRAPEDGEIDFVFDTKHAVGFLTDSGISILIHIGIDTVELKGKGFEVLVSPRDKVKQGTPLLRLDLEYLQEHAASMVSPVLFAELPENQKITLLKEGEVQVGDALFQIEEN